MMPQFAPRDLTKFLGRNELTAETLDIPYARKVLEHLVAHPEEHEQTYWGYRGSACGTKACIAGTTVLMDSQTTVLWSHNGDLAGSVGVNNQYMGLADRAAQLLGLNREDAHNLFYNGSNSDALAQLESYITAAEKVQYGS